MSKREVALSGFDGLRTLHELHNRCAVLPWEHDITEFGFHGVQSACIACYVRLAWTPGVVEGVALYRDLKTKDVITQTKKAIITVRVVSGK